MKVTRHQDSRPLGHTGPVRFSFSIKVSGDSGQSSRARAFAQADAKMWCNEVNASDLVFQFESVDDSWTEQGKLFYTAYFGTSLWLDN